jgi:two-component system cell cycle sensor histidine kinase/response regulator CckA
VYSWPHVFAFQSQPLSPVCPFPFFHIQPHPEVFTIPSAIKKVEELIFMASGYPLCEQLHEMQRLQMAGNLAGGIAHDLNNELTLILGNIELALDQLPVGYEVSDSLEHAKSAASRCADMSRRLLTASRDRRAAISKIDVAASVVEARKLLEYIKPPRIRVSCETELGLFIEGNANRIEQALLELGSNAFDAIEGEGEVEIRAYRGDGTMNIAVRDTGCGMAPALQKRAFDPFYTTRRKTGGSGLGLATVRSIVNSHAGAIGIESRVGEGTIFMMTFPAWQPDELTSLR